MNYGGNEMEPHGQNSTSLFSHPIQLKSPFPPYQWQPYGIGKSTSGVLQIPLPKGSLTDLFNMIVNYYFIEHNEHHIWLLCLLVYIPLWFLICHFSFFRGLFSEYSELQAANSEDQETKALVDQFFNLQDDLSQSRLVVQSLASTSQSKSSETEQEPNKDMLRLALALERKKNAQFWIKAALASDLTIPPSTEQTSDYNSTMKGLCISRNLSNYEPKVKSSGSSDRKLEWSRGSSLCATSDLASSLQIESREMFLAFVEQYLDGLRHRFSRETNDEIMGTMLQIKRVSDWIDKMAKKEAICPKISSEQEDSEFNPYGRVKNKIYRILLMHIEKTAMAWENMNEASQD